MKNYKINQTSRQDIPIMLQGIALGLVGFLMGMYLFVTFALPYLVDHIIPVSN